MIYYVQINLILFYFNKFNYTIFNKEKVKNERDGGRFRQSENPTFHYKNKWDLWSGTPNPLLKKVNVGVWGIHTPTPTPTNKHNENILSEMSCSTKIKRNKPLFHIL